MPKRKPRETYYQRLNKLRQFLAATTASTEDEARAAFLATRHLCGEGNDDADDEMLSVADAARIVNAHQQTLRRWWKADLFPKPRKLGPARIGLSKTEVLIWLASRPAVGAQQKETHG